MKLKKFLLIPIFMVFVSSSGFSGVSQSDSFVHQDHTEHIEATCTGKKNCRACKNCKYCKHCSKQGGTCGVCN
ncbi:MAG: hypothetical protein WBF83_00045 [Moheibacter sp.]